MCVRRLGGSKVSDLEKEWYKGNLKIIRELERIEKLCLVGALEPLFIR